MPRRVRWVLDTLGARELAVGEEVSYDAGAWAQVERGERPEGDELAGAFWHLARLERSGERDRHGRFPASASALDPLDPPLERLRARLGIEPPLARRPLRGRAHPRRRPALALDGSGCSNAVGRLAPARAGAGRDAPRGPRPGGRPDAPPPRQ